jgi:hypothetical protein
MKSVFINLIVLVWSLILDGYFIAENRGIKSGLVYCELEGWVLPTYEVDCSLQFIVVCRFSYSFFTLIGIVLACVQLTLLIVCCGCLKAEECLRVRSYTIDLLWAIAKEVPQIFIIFQLNLCRDGWFKMSSLCKALLSICITIWKLYNLRTFLREDITSDDIPNWFRAKRLYMCFPIFLIPVWLVNLALSVMIAILFVRGHHGAAYIDITGSAHPLYVQDTYLYNKYIAHAGIYLRWPDANTGQSYMKLAEIDYIMANKQLQIDLSFRMPYICFQRSSSLDRTAAIGCFQWNNTTHYLHKVSDDEVRLTNATSQNASFVFHYKTPLNKYDLGQITYQGDQTRGPLFLDNLLYFRLHHAHRHGSDSDFLSLTSHGDYQFYIVNQQLIPIEKAWRYGLGKCRPCVFGPQLSAH